MYHMRRNDVAKPLSLSWCELVSRSNGVVFGGMIGECSVDDLRNLRRREGVTRGFFFQFFQ